MPSAFVVTWVVAVARSVMAVGLAFGVGVGVGVGGGVDSAYVQERPAQNVVQGAGLIDRKAGLSAARRFVFGLTPPKHAAEPRDCPCRPRATRRVGVRVRARVRVRVRVRPGVGICRAMRARLRLTTRVLHKGLCRAVLHITGAGGVGCWWRLWWRFSVLMALASVSLLVVSALVLVLV